MINNNKTVLAGRILSGLAMLPFIPSAFMKLTMNPKVVEGMTHFGFSQSSIMVLAVLEVLSVVLYLIPKTAVLGAILITGYLGGAICTHLRVGENVATPVILGVIAWAGLWLRDARLQSLLPIKK
jgi:hypothetical protein